MINWKQYFIGLAVVTGVCILAATIAWLFSGCGPNPYLPRGYYQVSISGRPAYCWQGDRDIVFAKVHDAYPPYELVYSEVDYGWAYACVQRPRRY